MLALRDLGLAHSPRMRRLLEGWSMKRVGRPPLDYDVKHVTINMKAEHYKRMRRDGENMSKVINDYLDNLYAYTICPSCYGDDFEVRRCAKCGGRSLICDNFVCALHQVAQRRECMKRPEPCSRSEFIG
jgi:hypothetical protein